MILVGAIVSLLLAQTQAPQFNLFHPTTESSTTRLYLPSWLATVLNGYVHLWLLYLFTAFCLDFSIVSNLLTNGGTVYFEEGFANPLLASRTFRQAWGERWNKTVGLLLKRTIYIPARQDGNLPASMAALLTFWPLEPYTNTISPFTMERTITNRIWERP